MLIRTISGVTYVGEFKGYVMLGAMYKAKRFIWLRNARGRDVYLLEKLVAEIDSCAK